MKLYTVEEWKAALHAERRQRHGKPAGSVYASKLEADYAVELENRRRLGFIKHWDYEPEKLRIALRCFYTPDFRVVLNDGAVEMHEVKGYMREDAAIKLKVAADRYRQWRFVLVRQRRGVWVTTVVEPAPA